MPYISARDGTRLYFEAAGRGAPLVFVHEFSGDHRSWEAQMRYFSRRYRCVAVNARGYPPSEVPRARAKYSQKIVVDDIADLMHHLKLGKSHVVGCSMGGYSALNFGIRYTPRALSVTAVGAGAGSHPQLRAGFLRGTEANARRFEALGMPRAARQGGVAAGRVAQSLKDPRGYAEFKRYHEEHSATGLANTQRGVQAKRPNIYELGPKLRKLKLPLLVVAGDEDDNCVEPGVFIKQVCASARLWICPGTGHTVNTEEPALFNHMLSEFLSLVDSGRWRPRDPRSVLVRR